MKKALLFLLELGFLLQVITEAQDMSSDVTVLASKNTDFATSLYREISSASDDNVFFSPLCVSSALAALSMGAQGITREKILQGLGITPLDQEDQPKRIPELFQKLREEVTKNEGLQYNPTTALFIRQQLDVSTDYTQVIKQYFGANISKVDFTNAQVSKASINDYVKSKTGDKVKEVVSTVDPQATLMLISSIFFQGNWKIPFAPMPEERFFVNKYKIVQVTMLFSSEKHYLAYDPTMKLGVLKLPYQGGVAMLVLLPDKDVDYTSIDEVLTGDRFLGWIKMLKKIKLEVVLPMFSLEQSYAMKTVLPDMGISNVFESADLSGLSEEPNLNLSEMIHKAAIEVKKSDISAMDTPMDSAPPRLTINRPFLFVIYHEATNSPLFMGRVIDPTKK
ncbi:hypothetical protein COCON_G00095480 [Conger conger]|uniref:Serpin domain-containing protein n=1 Tax=Conger conger TaxID=82655 RepID=A0A9Q1DM05_CONCO|nr:protein Z-dependent protease inhibitor-like [Conger conger]KAJ8274923.1 hypothetical protein COCON_G00095480 [Conger conger]